jgi:CRISPR-associated exonuclease Cas4
MDYDESDYLMISGLRHFAFCRRRWALVHIEQLWQENVLTQDGHFMHERVHDQGFTEKRGRLLLSRGMAVKSHTLGVAGVCDMVELEESENGVPIAGRSGTYRIFPVEYKRGKPEGSKSDTWQLCAQAMCLEEMFCTDVPEGAVYYGSIRRRETVIFDTELRNAVMAALDEMRRLMDRRYTPKVKPRKVCLSCSMQELCQPGLMEKPSAAAYVRQRLREV